MGRVSRFLVSAFLSTSILAACPVLAAETTRTVTNTAYADQDNDPPGSNAIAFPKSDGYPTVHNGTGGTGTCADPITIAADPRDFPPGTKLYVPSMKFYGVVEDTCANCIADRTAGRPTKIDFFVGGKSATNAQTAAYESSITTNGATRQIIVNADPGKDVIVGPLYETSRKTALANNPGGSPDTTCTVTQPPATNPTLKVPPVFGWNDAGSGYARNDAVLSFKDGAIRVTGTGFPAAEIDQTVANGQAYTASVTITPVTPSGQAIGWLKVTDENSTVVYVERTNVQGPQTFSFTATTPIVRVWVGTPAGGTPQSVDISNLTFAPSP
jgi:3D (Asp-Asp-Asp) domain-containing protein